MSAQFTLSTNSIILKISHFIQTTFVFPYNISMDAVDFVSYSYGFSGYQGVHVNQMIIHYRNTENLEYSEYLIFAVVLVVVFTGTIQCCILYILIMQF